MAVKEEDEDWKYKTKPIQFTTLSIKKIPNLKRQMSFKELLQLNNVNSQILI